MRRVFFTVGIVVLYYFAFWTTVTEGNNENPMYATFLVVLVILLVAASFMNPITYYFTVLLNSVFVVFPKSVQLVDTYAFEMKNISQTAWHH